MTTDLYTVADVKRIRDLLAKEQHGLCKVTGHLLEKQAVLDHAHDEDQLVRGVLHRQVNAFAGKTENAYDRLLGWWYPEPLYVILRHLADYLEDCEKNPTKYRHPGWIKKINTKFNKLKEPSKDSVLESLGQPRGSNAKQRKELFRKSVLSRQFGYEFLKTVIKKASNND